MLSGSNFNQVFNLHFDFRHINLKSLVIKETHVFTVAPSMLRSFNTTETYWNTHIKKPILPSCSLNLGFKTKPFQHAE